MLHRVENARGVFRNGGAARRSGASVPETGGVLTERQFPTFAFNPSNTGSQTANQVRTATSLAREFLAQCTPRPTTAASRPGSPLCRASIAGGIIRGMCGRGCTGSIASECREVCRLLMMECRVLRVAKRTTLDTPPTHRVLRKQTCSMGG